MNRYLSIISSLEEVQANEDGCLKGGFVAVSNSSGNPIPGLTSDITINAGTCLNNGDCNDSENNACLNKTQCKDTCNDTCPPRSVKTYTDLRPIKSGPSSNF